MARFRLENAAVQHLDRDFVVKVDDGGREWRASELRHVAPEHDDLLDHEDGGDNVALDVDELDSVLRRLTPHTSAPLRRTTPPVRESARPRAPAASSEARVSSA